MVAPVSEDTPADCTRCGTCCFSESERHVQVSGDDYERLSEGADDAEDWVHWIGNQAFLKITGSPGRCSALQVADGRYLCAIYERRPEICRTLERGSPACAGERALKELRVRPPTRPA